MAIAMSSDDAVAEVDVVDVDARERRGPARSAGRPRGAADRMPCDVAVAVRVRQIAGSCRAGSARAPRSRTRAGLPMLSLRIVWPSSSSRLASTSAGPADLVAGRS